jgi:hypothetical protein
VHVEFFFSGCEPVQAGGSLTCGPGRIGDHVDRVVCPSNDKVVGIRITSAVQHPLGSAFCVTAPSFVSTKILV